MAKIKLLCLECGRRFQRAKPTLETRCPKCHSTDIDLDEHVVPVRHNVA